MVLPEFVPAATLRPMALSRPEALPAALAPSVTVQCPAEPPVELTLTSGGDRVRAHFDGRSFSLSVTTAGRTTRHRSRRASRPSGPVESVALTLTGRRATVASLEDGGWLVRGLVDLDIDTHDETWLAGLRAEGGDLRGFGQLGLRDLRLVTHADGSAYLHDGYPLLTATSAGPGFFDTAHASVWSLDPVGLTLTHRSDLFFRRPDRPGVHGDHACHLLRDGDRWLVAASTWGDFEPKRRDATVAVTLAETTADLLAGRHVLDTRPLPLPTTGFRSVGVWDPHLVRTEEGWLVGYVSARKFFRFHPVLASGPSLEDLTVRGALTDHRETEGSTLVRVDDAWRLLASDGTRRRYPMLDLDLAEVGELSAPYPSNIPWPTLVPTEHGLLQVCFDGEPTGGEITGYGTHGTVHLHRSAPAG